MASALWILLGLAIFVMSALGMLIGVAFIRGRRELEHLREYRAWADPGAAGHRSGQAGDKR